MTRSAKLSRLLVDVAMGRAAADLVIRNGRWVCVQSGEIIRGTDVAVKAGRIAYVGPDAGHCIGRATKVLNARGRHIVPGLLDAHMHVESGMVTVTEFVRAILPRGTTGIFIDPHEIANVFGLKGVRLMVNEAAKQPIHVWVQVPSCVPAMPGLETSGASIGPADIAQAIEWPGVIGLGEMMNFPGVQAGDRRMLAEMAIAQAANKTVGGHYASPDLGKAFHGYAVAGAEDDHEGTRQVDAVARVRQGMKPMLRYGSAAHDVAAQVGAITGAGLDSRRFMLCTDDSHAETLAHEGHMDRVLRHAMAEGLAPMTAIQMATLNTAEHFGLSREIGMIAPGRWADLLLVGNLRSFQPEVVIAKGTIAARGGRLQVPGPKFEYPAWAKQSVHLRRPVKAEDFVLRSPQASERLMANVIGVVENQLPTRHLRMRVQAAGGQVRADPTRDIAKVALIQRHKGMNGTTLGLVHGFGFTGACAVASTVAHDCHQLLVVGTDDACMAQAANQLMRDGGGQLVVKDNKVIGRVELEIAGLMSTEKVEVVARKARRVLDGFAAIGCRMNNPNIQLSFLALTAIPQLRISDLGLVDVSGRQLIPVLERG
ncbi:MAG TPA: adenine deaminase [Anaerolineales bacterium]|nr:adenine deaminase [Anaerolineales bacterium]